MNIKFKMPHWGRNIKLKGMAKEIFMTVIATTISIVLTFGTAAWQDKCKKDELRRQMAMMVINDVDKTISVVEKMLALEDAGFNATRYVRDHIDNFEKISQDSVNMFLSYISNLVISTDVEFNISNEHIFNSRIVHINKKYAHHRHTAISKVNRSAKGYNPVVFIGRIIKKILNMRSRKVKVLRL